MSQQFRGGRREKKAAARRRSATEAGKEAAGVATKGGREKERGDKKPADLEREVRGIFTSRVYRYFNRHRGYISTAEGGAGGGGRRTGLRAGNGPGVLSSTRGQGKCCPTATTTPAWKRDPRSGRQLRAVASCLETRTHCKAFLMTEEILSYTHPFRTPRLQRERFVSGGVNLRIGVECRRRSLGGRGASLTALTTCHWR